MSGGQSSGRVRGELSSFSGPRVDAEASPAAPAAAFVAVAEEEDEAEEEPSEAGGVARGIFFRTPAKDLKAVQLCVDVRSPGGRRETHESAEGRRGVCEGLRRTLQGLPSGPMTMSGGRAEGAGVGESTDMLWQLVLCGEAPRSASVGEASRVESSRGAAFSFFLFHHTRHN